MVAGSHRSNFSRSTVPWKPCGATPTMVMSRPLTRINLPHGGRRTREVTLPILVRDYRHRLAAGSGGFVETEEAPSRRLQAEGREVVAGDQQAVRAFHLTRFADVERRHSERQQVAKRMQAFAQIAVLEPGRTWVHAGFGARLDEVKARGVGDAGNRLKDDGLNPREDDDVDADADAEREDDHERQDGHPHDHATRVPHVTA